MTLGDRIKQLRKSMDMSQVEFGRYIGVSGATISTSESGKTTPDSQTIEIICMKCNVNKVWLLHGKGEMRSTGPFEPELHKILRRHPDLQAALELLVEDNDPEFWAALNTVARKLVEQKKKKEAE